MIKGIKISTGFTKNDTRLHLNDQALNSPDEYFIWIKNGIYNQSIDDNVDVMVFVRWDGKNPFNDNEAEYVWCGNQSAILIVPSNIYYSLRLFVMTGWRQHITELQLIKHKKHKPAFARKKPY